jgi:hypothetical protein
MAPVSVLFIFTHRCEVASSFLALFFCSIMALVTANAPYPRHMALVYFLFALLHVAIAANIDDVFRVKAGTTNGGCDAYRARLQSYLDDTQTFVRKMAHGR